LRRSIARALARSPGGGHIDGSNLWEIVWLRRPLTFLASLALLLVGQGGHPSLAAAPAGFGFNWQGAPGTPQPWMPGQVNDWDLISNIDGPTDNTGTMEASHGPDCAAPPAAHHVTSLADSAFICKNHMMTAVYGGGDANTTYGAVYFSPAQLVDFSSREATVSWQVSTYRSSARDWWDVWITPFDQNLVIPLDADLPAYQGVPKTALHVMMDNGLCQTGQPATLGVTNGAPVGSIFRAELIQNFQATQLPQHDSCVEDGVPASAATRTPFQLDLSSGHVRFSMPGTNSVWVDQPLQLPFNQAVVQLAHHSYNPDKACSHPCPGTFHWSNFSISQPLPFTMLRPQQPISLHEGREPVLQLPQPAPANSFLRFAALGKVQVSFDAGKSFQPAQQQAQTKHKPEAFSSYWTPVPAGTSSLSFRGQPPDGTNLPYWIEDVSVWSRSAAIAGAAPAPAPAAQPVAAPDTAGSSSGVTRAKAAVAFSGGQPPVTPQRAIRALMVKAGSARALWSYPSFLLGLLVPLLALGIFAFWRRRAARRTPPAGPPPDPQPKPSSD
jgi:hypothetical protein